MSRFFACSILFAALWLALAASPPRAAEPPRLEADYVARWCEGNNHLREFRIESADSEVRVDCYIRLADRGYAVEFDFSSKYAECAAQSILYAGLLGGEVRAACALIRSPGTSAAAFRGHVERFRIIARAIINPPVLFCISASGDERRCPL